MSEVALKEEWYHLLEISGVPLATGISDFDNLCHAYSEPHRHYHTLAHIKHLLTTLKQTGFSSPAGLWAIWYHDYVYQPGASDNEARSAEFAKSLMSRLGIDPATTNKTIEIILATKDHKIETASDEMLIVLDADMAILGESAAKYEEYKTQVSEEFRSIPKDLYKRGRKKFLEAVLSQHRIYQTDFFGARYETRARQNMLNEISSLDAF